MLIPFPYQTAAIDDLRTQAKLGKRRLLLCMLMGAGKAQPLTSRIYTPGGPVTMGSVEVGDKVLTPDGGSANVIGVFPQGTLPIYRVTFRDGSYTECCADHLWYVNKPHRRYAGLPGYVMSTQQIMDGGLFNEQGNAKWFIPVTCPAGFDSESNVPIDPYLLGLLIGDGCIKYNLMFSTADEEIVDSVRRILPPEYSINKKADSYDWSITTTIGQPNPIAQELRYLNLWGCGSHDKFIPHWYLYGPVDRRIAMLQGLMDTDGSTSDKATLEYTTVSWKLARHFVELVQSLGGTASARFRITTCTYNGTKTEHGSHRIHFKLPPDIVPFRLKRKLDRYRPASKYPPSRAIVSIEPMGEEECQCIAIDSPDKLYLTDDFIVTHNTLVAMELMRLCQEKQLRSLFLCDRRMLGDQGVKRAIEQQLDAGQIMSGRGHDLDAMCQFASKQTVESWLKTGKVELPNFDLIIVDEAHRAVSPKWQALFDRWPNAVRVGLTATPCLGNGNGMGKYYDYLCQPIQPSQLKAMGRLVPVRAFAPHVPDLKGCRKDVDGDYSAKSLSERMRRENMIGDIAGWWKRVGENRPSIYFACDVAHALSIKEEFIQAGIPAEIIVDETDDDTRLDIERRSKNGELLIVINCDVLAEGVDWPWISCIGLVRPTKRLRRYLQNSGRGMRADEGKKDCLIIDHSGCVLYHGFPDTDREWPLDACDNIDKVTEKKNKDKQPSTIRCAKCCAVFSGTRKCPECGHMHAFQKSPKDYAQGRGSLVEVGAGTLPADVDANLRQRYWGSCIGRAIKLGKPAAMAAGMFRGKFGIAPWNAGVAPMVNGPEWKRPAVEVFPGFLRSRV